MDKEEPEGLRKATGGIPARKWELPTGLTLEKQHYYGVDLFVDYITVEIQKGGSSIEIDEGVGKLLSYREMRDMEEQALESEIEMYLDSDMIPEEEETDEGKMVKLTDEERRDKARDLAEQSELEYGSEVLEQLAQDIDDDDQIPDMFEKQVDCFWADEGASGPDRGKKPENEMSWLGPGEEEFLDTVREAGRKMVIEEDEIPSTLKAYAVAVSEIMDRLSRQDFMATFRRTIPVWSFMRLKYQLKKKDIKEMMTPKELQEEKDRLDQMRHWLRMHKTEMSDAARRMLDKKEAGGAAPKTVKKGKQMTVEMKKAKVKPRFNPEIADDLADYYHAVGIDPEVPVGWLMAQGATPDQITEAADRLLKADRIDPPDYWAITAAVAGADYHVGVTPVLNPTPEELAKHRKLREAVEEKHGKLPDQADKLFKKLKARHKGKTDAEIMDMVKEQLGIKKRQNPSFKSAREALKDALKRLTIVEVVEYTPYEPPKPEPTAEESIESLERTAEEAMVEEEDVGVKALEDLGADMVQDDWKRMFEKERKEHPTLPEEVVKKIVDDHMDITRRIAYLDSKTGGEERENPSAEDKVIKAFWEEEEARGPKATPMGDIGTSAERRDEVEVRGAPFIPGEPGLSVVRYMLWGNLIASLDHDEQGHKTFHISTAGWDTKLTNDRLHAILSAGQKRYPILRRFNISKREGIRLYKVHRLRKLDPEKPWQTHEWKEICPVSETLYRPTDLPKGQMAKYSVYIDLEAILKENIDRLTGKGVRHELEEMELPVDTLEEVRTAIDNIEKGIAEHRAANRDFDSTPIEIADKLGTRQRLEDLLKQRDELMWKENPKIPYTPPDAPDVEVRCPVTGKNTWSCTRCALFKGRSEQFIECRAKKSKKYHLAKARDKRGTVWDTYVLPQDQRKAGIETRAIGGD